MKTKKKAWMFVLLGVLLLGWMASLLFQESPQSDRDASLRDVRETVFVGEAELGVEEGEITDIVDLPAVDEALVEASVGGEATVRSLGVNGALGDEALRDSEVEPEDVESYAVVTGLIVFGAQTEESRLSSSSGGLSEETRDLLVARWKERDLSMVPLDPIALRRPDWAIMEITWNSADGSEVFVSSNYVDRSTFYGKSQSDLQHPAVGTSGVRLWLWMKEGSRKCEVDSATWTNGVSDHMGDLGSMKVSQDGAATHYQFHWSGEDYSLLMSVEERSREVLEIE